MTHPNRAYELSLRFFRNTAGVLLLSAAVSACAGLVGQDPRVVSELYKGDRSFVRIERIETGAGNNSHPFAVSAEAIHNAFANLKVAGSISTDAKPVFTDGELKEIVPFVAAALAKAGTGEDVTFSVTGERGIFGKYSPRDLTTGRIFAAGGQLNVVFGHMHERYDIAGPVQTFKPGARATRTEYGWGLIPGVARLKEGRTDWAMFDVAALTAIAPPAPPPQTTAPTTTPAPAAPAPAAPAGVQGRYEELEGKLRILDRLKANGLITEEEYREKRHAILQQL